MAKKLIQTYTVEEIAKYLKLHPYAVRRLCWGDKILGFPVGTRAENLVGSACPPKHQRRWRGLM